MTSLFHLEKEGDVDELVRLLRNSESEAVRQRAAEIIGELDVSADADGPKPVESLVSAAQNDSDPAVRAAAIDALDQQEAVEKLIAAMAGKDLDTDGADWVKAEAFIEALGSSEPEMRMAAATVLGRIGNPAATQALLKRLVDPHPRVRSRVARALGRIEDQRAVSALATRLTDESVDVRRESADALGRIGGSESLAALVALLEDDSETIRHIAASSLGNFSSIKPVDALVEALGDGNDIVRRAAVFSLIEILSNAPPSKSHTLRETVVEKLSSTDDLHVIVALVEILDEGVQPHQRRNATWLLGRVAGQENGDEAIDALIDALGDDDEMTAQFATASLASIGGRAVEDALLDVLNSESVESSTRAKAAFTLGKVGGERTRRRLDRLIDETSNDEIRKRAFSALSKLGGRT